MIIGTLGTYQNKNKKWRKDILNIKVKRYDIQYGKWIDIETDKPRLLTTLPRLSMWAKNVNQDNPGHFILDFQVNQYCVELMLFDCNKRDTIQIRNRKYGMNRNLETYNILFENDLLRYEVETKTIVEY